MNFLMLLRGVVKWVFFFFVIGSFGIGMIEFVVMGLLFDIVVDLLFFFWVVCLEEVLS